MLLKQEKGASIKLESLLMAPVLSRIPVQHQLSPQPALNARPVLTLGALGRMAVWVTIVQ